jgi:hypothetical protein
MPLDAAGKNTAAEAVASTYQYLALFDGATELSGAGYTRIQVSTSAGSNGVVTITGTPYTFDIPSGATVSHFGLFTAVSGGTRGGYEALSSSAGPYAADGQYNFTGGSITVS